MNFWTAAVIIVAIWGLVQLYTRRHDRELGVARDEDGNPVFAPRDEGRTTAELETARSEVAELKERVKVLERIVTDANSGDARERARIAAEIEALRALPTASKEEPGQ
jgi:signal transduction histidine kinase